MLRFVMRHGLVRLIGGRAVPAMIVWDIAVVANRARRIPIVDRGLRRGAGAAVRGADKARRGLGTVVPLPRWPLGPIKAIRPIRPNWPSRSTRPAWVHRPEVSDPPGRPSPDGPAPGSDA